MLKYKNFPSNPIADHLVYIGGTMYAFPNNPDEHKGTKVTLERLVEERTAELVQANKALQAEIAERKQLEQALRASEERYRALYRDNPSMFFTLDKDGTVISVNAFGASQLGYTIDELVGQSVLKVFYEADKTAVTIQLQRCIQHPGQIDRWQFRKVRKDGTMLWVEELAHAVTAPDGAINVLVVCQDITDRKQAELEQERLLSQIREQAQQVQNIIDTVPEGVVLLNQEQVVTLTNPVARQYLALLAPEWENGRLSHLGSHTLPELLISPPNGLWHEISTNKQQYEVIARPVENGPTNQEWVLVLREVTQERTIQRRVQERERLAAVGQLAAGIAHDFNNILAVISLYTQLSLKTDTLSPKMENMLQTIEQQSRRASDLVQQILDFGRQSIMKRRSMDLVFFLQELLTLLQRTLPENIHIDFLHDDDEYIVHADPSRMQQVFMNLAVNARDAMPEGGHLTLKLDLTEITSEQRPPLLGMTPGRWVQITLSDTGSGIPPDVLTRIFEPFFTTKGIRKGTGLGLAQVHGIVQQHQGFIDVRSEVGQGTTFMLYFPVHAAKSQRSSQAIPEVLPKGCGETVLVVEDETAVRQIMIESLTILNYTVMAAQNGREALNLLQQHKDEINLVLSDVIMPEIGGIALLQAVRELGLNIPFVMITGHAIENDMETLRELGLHDWLVKPPDLSELAHLVARHTRPIEKNKLDNDC